jgi:hypothetical protein
MPVPPIPPPLEQFPGRPFSFFPPILNIEHNQWHFVRSTWSEVLVRNSKTEMELWISRRLLGEVSRIDEPVMIVGLRQELEYKAGTVLPHERRVIKMPHTTADAPHPPAPSVAPPHPVTKGRRRASAESRIGRLILGALVIGVAVCFLAIMIFRGGPGGDKVTFHAIVQSDLGLTAADDYFAVLRKLGPPAADRWRSSTGELQYRLLWYPQQSVSVILMGSDRNHIRYIGAMDKDWKPVDSVTLPNDNVNTASMLRALKRF